MATEGEVRFLRSSYLLLKGTFYLVKKVLLREAENVRQQTGRDLDGLLKDYEQQLKHEFRHRKHREKLFPPSGKTDVENWDISLLTGVLLIVFQKSLPDVDRTAIKNIKYQRNDIYAHCHEASLNEVDYTDTCNYLKDAFNTLASGCNAAVKQECDAIIQTCLNGALDCKSHVELLIQLAEKDNMLVEIIAKIKPIELREKVLKALQQALQGQRRIEVKVVDSHLGICGTDEDQDNIALAENIIVTVINEAIRREQTCEENTCIREIIQEILDEITSQTGVRPISADKGCVIIRFDCCSNEQLFQFIIYMESKDMKERLNKLADSLSRLLNTKEKLQVSFSLSLETLKSILDEITPKVQREYKRSVHIPIQIESVKGIKRVFDLFEGGGLTNNLQKLSEALTEKVGAQINVKPTINMKQLKEALEDFDPVEDPARQIGKTEECRSEEGATGHKGKLYEDAEEGGDESTQIDLTEDIYTEREEPEEQNIQENPFVVTLRSPVQYRECLFHLQSLVIDVGTGVLRNFFYHNLQDGALDVFLAIEMKHIKYLKQQKLITKAQFNLLYPPGGQPSNSAEFDDTLVFILAKYLSSFTSLEECFWMMPMGICVETYLYHFYGIMDEIVRLTRRFQPLCFSIIKNDIEFVLLRLNATLPEPLANMNERIKRCETKSLDPEAEQRNQDIFDLWEQIQFTSVIHLRTIRTTVPKKRQDHWDINPQVTAQNVKKIDMIGGFRRNLKQNIEQDVTFIKKDIKSSVTKEIEHGVPKRNETGGTYRQIKSDHEEDIFTEKEEPEEQNIQEKPSDEKSIQKDNAKDESSDESSEENETEIVLSNRECLFRLQCLVIDVGTDVLRNVFDQRLQGMALDTFLANELEHFKMLKQQRALTIAQFNLLYPPGGRPSNIAEFDVTLILLLLRYLPSVELHALYKRIYWPRPTDTNLCRLCDIIDEIVRLTRRFQPLYFDTIKTEIEEVLLRLNNTLDEPLANIYERIEKCETKTLDPAAEQRNQDILYQWELIQFAPLIHLRPTRTKVPKKRQDFGDINPQVTIQNVKKVDLFGGFRSEMGQKQYVKQDVTSITKDLKSIEADLKSIKTEDIEHGVSKGNEAEST